MMDLVYIKNGNIITSSGVIENGSILISNDKIVAIAKGEVPIKADYIIDAGSKLILPGAIDVHPHIDDPKFFEGREDFATGTKSAIVGGVTSMVEMPTWNPVLDKSTIQEKIERGKKMSYIDFKIHAGNVREILKESIVDELKKLGVISYKTFTCDPYLCTDYTIYENFRRYAEAGIIFMFHAENNEILKGIKSEFNSKNLKSARYHHLTRPPIAEIEAVNRILLLAEKTGARIYFVHISLGESVRLIENAKKRNVDVRMETCPHYIYFTDKDMERLGPYLKVNPPVRSENDKSALVSYLNAEVIDVIASDHYPTFKNERELGWEDMDKVRSGLPGIGTLYQSIINLMLNNILRPEVVVKTLSENPAKIFGIYNRKGGIAVGKDADIVILDPKKEVKVDPERFLIHSGWTPFDGMIFKGYIEKVLLRGEVVVEDYEIKVKRPAIYLGAA
jgi:dihydropyrimidinase/dihydroorotase